MVGKSPNGARDGLQAATDADGARNRGWYRRTVTYIDPSLLPPPPPHIRRGSLMPLGRSACAADQKHPLQRSARRHMAWNFILPGGTQPAWRVAPRSRRFFRRGEGVDCMCNQSRPMSHAKKDTGLASLLFGDRWENLVAKDDAGIADHVGYK